MRCRGAGFSHLGQKQGQEDRWAVAELPDGVVAAVADGMSNPSGRPGGEATGSSAVAETACSVFVDFVSREMERSDAIPSRVLQEGLGHAMDHAERVAAKYGGGCTLVGAWLGSDGQCVTVGIGDSGAWAFDGHKQWRSVYSMDSQTDHEGRLRNYLGMPSGQRRREPPRATERKAVSAVLLGTDGLFGYAGTVDEFGKQLSHRHPTDQDVPFHLARDLVMKGIQEDGTDNTTAVVLARTAPLHSPLTAGIPFFFLVTLMVLSGAVGAVAGRLLSREQPAPTGTEPLPSSDGSVIGGPKGPTAPIEPRTASSSSKPQSPVPAAPTPWPTGPNRAEQALKALGADLSRRMSKCRENRVGSLSETLRDRRDFFLFPDVPEQPSDEQNFRAYRTVDARRRSDAARKRTDGHVLWKLVRGTSRGLEEWIPAIDCVLSELGGRPQWLQADAVRCATATSPGDPNEPRKWECIQRELP